MLLGELLSKLEGEDDAGEALGALGDIVLFAEVQSMGERYGEAPGEYVAGAASRFAASAGDEDWLTLMGAIDRSDAPLQSALRLILRWSLDKDARGDQATAHAACSCGSTGCAPQTL
ncbi:MAG TPA: hypothetical protein VFV47_09240 [Hyphomicrobiaceae bacterium]|nr:hypothetical protein [Hyphomicrobiaceae bacterium]